MNIKPGDLFEWVYKGNNTPVLKDEELYSYTMRKWILAGGLCLCVGIDENIIHWVSGIKLFHAYLEEMTGSGASSWTSKPPARLKLASRGLAASDCTRTIPRKINP